MNDHDFHPYPKPLPKGKKKPHKIGAGPKTLAWAEALQICKAQFEEWGITRCEIQMDGCWQDNALSFAHVDKRKYLQQGELMAVCLACIPCHQKLEAMPHQQMRKIIMAIIKNRITF